MMTLMDLLSEVTVGVGVVVRTGLSGVLWAGLVFGLGLVLGLGMGLGTPSAASSYRAQVNIHTESYQ